MTAADLALARILLSVTAALGLLGLAALFLLDLGGGLARTGLDCLMWPFVAVDLAVHGLTLVLLASIAAIGLTSHRAWRRQRTKVSELRCLLRFARRQPIPARVRVIARDLGILDCLVVVTIARPVAFTAGWARPWIVISSGVIERLGDDELRALLHHESWHRCRRDPLRILAARIAMAPFRRAGQVRKMAQRHLLALEIAADRHAIEQMGHHRPLASALMKTVDCPVSVPSTPGFASHLNDRVGALTSERPSAIAGSTWPAGFAVTAELLVLAGFLHHHGIALHTAFGYIHPLC